MDILIDTELAPYASFSPSQWLTVSLMCKFKLTYKVHFVAGLHSPVTASSDAQT